MGFLDILSDFMGGTPEKRENVSTLRGSQKGAYKDLQGAARGKYGPGAFGQAGKYYSDLMSNDSADYNAFAAPEQRQFAEQTIPDLAEQFAGMGSGGMSSSGFRNAGAQAGVDLGERLGAMRAQLRQRGAEGLQNIGNQALGNFSTRETTQQGSPGLLQQAIPALARAGTAYATGGMSEAVPAAGGIWNSQKRNSGPYQGQGGINA